MLFRDRFVQFSCANSGAGCTFRDTKERLAQHEEEVCRFAKAPCQHRENGCGQRLEVRK